MADLVELFLFLLPLMYRSLVFLLLLWGSRCVQDLRQVASWLCTQYIYHHLLSPGKTKKKTRVIAANGLKPARDWYKSILYKYMHIYHSQA